MALTVCLAVFRWPTVVFIVLCTLTKSLAETHGCSGVRNAYASKGHIRSDVPQQMISGEHLRICPQGLTCCTRIMEETLEKQTELEYDKLLGDKVGLVRTTFITRTAKFDAFFTELLDNAKKDLHEMFVRTYGLLYQQNSHVFTDLFADLRNYYKGNDINLLDALDRFFTTLLQKMFELLNAQYTFDQAYLQCVSEHMDDLKPFGDVPQKLSIQVKRAFIAARTFVQGLTIGRDVVLAVSKLRPSDSCHTALMKMMYCPYCRGVPNLQPCNNYCMNVMKGCLAYHADLNKEWNEYINALLKVAERLEGPFNIESVVDPIDVKISDAIMNFQENSDTVSSKVLQGCGQPKLGRKKRETGGGGSDWQNSRKQAYVRPTTAAGTSLDRLVRDIRTKVEVAKDYWKGLPHAMCNKVASPMQEKENCWNGNGKSQYMPEVMRDGVMGQINNPEVEVDVRKPNFVVSQQILQLKVITNKLKNAYNGLDVDWIDTADVYGSGSGSADGESGSGDGGYKTPNDEINFTQASTHYPPVIKTHKPVKGQPKDDSSASQRHTACLLLVALSTLLLANTWW